ncbi:DUF4214 domain-containing protein [Orrella daihaiensis]|uniref:DUF4214 domain-containing protein n=1 Tax=Orrella daihaiensis TaxID=2782176 RepID=A0ABY4ANV1_9BURK|nr:DUF4214 domain-containing protein [Orrella daihaiensis]UOD50710.1 DUF4214 domain-containing protein [Orrella daihaiensis]
MNKLDIGVGLQQSFLIKHGDQVDATHGKERVIGDFNGDGIHDLAVAFGNRIPFEEISRNPPQIFLGTQAGLVHDTSFAIANSPQIQSVSRVEAPDINGDGISDLFFGSATSGEQPPAYQNLPGMYAISGSNGFQGYQLEGEDFYHHIRVADVNGDGYPDVLFPGIGGESYFVTGGATPSVTDANIPNNLLRFPNWDVLETYPNGWIKTALWRQTQTVNFVDANRDGHPDLLLLPKGDPHHLLFLNDGTGNFSKSVELRVDAAVPGFEQWGRYAEFVPSSGPNPYEIVGNPVPTKGINYYGSLTYDINGDGWEDLINAGPYIDTFRAGNENNNEQAIQILINDGALFQNETAERISQIEYEVILNRHQGYLIYELVDINGDGHMDLMLSTSFSGYFSPRNTEMTDPSGQKETVFFLNDGTGHFSEVTVAGLPNVNLDIMPVDGKLAFVALPSVTMEIPYNPELGSPWDNSANTTQFDVWITNTPWTRGDEGNNFVHGTTISETIDGGLGTDTLVVLGRSSQYDVDLAGGRPVSIHGLDGMSGTDTLVSVERIKFYDTTVAFDTDGVAGQAYRIYKAAFDRAPDLTGLGYWIKAIDAGATLDSVAAGFVGSSEFQTTYGNNINNTDFITLLYANVLDRTPDDSGFDYWLTRMSEGMTREQVLANFSESGENKANVAELIADGIQYTAFMG